MSTFSIELKLNMISKFQNQGYLEGASESLKRQVRRFLSLYSTLDVLGDVYLFQRKTITVEGTLMIQTMVNEIHRINCHIGIIKTDSLIKEKCIGITVEMICKNLVCDECNSMFLKHFVSVF